MSELPLVVVWAGAYLLGAVPFGLLIGRALGHDPRQHGSGNIGATNVARRSGWAAGTLTLALDAGKGVAAVWAAAAWCTNPAAPAGAAVAAVFGHAFPIYLRFKGGKGVATAAGAFALLSPWAALACGGVFLILLVASRTVSLGSVGAAVALPVFTVWLVPGAMRVEAAALCALVILLRHRENLQRLGAGAENRIGGPKHRPAHRPGPPRVL
jgi:glycerol-3-phosphate acyltransferase PlsY